MEKLQPFFDVLVDLPVVIQAAAIAAMVALAGTYVSTRITKGQLQVSRQTLFVSLLEKRIIWLSEFRDAVKARDEEIGEIPVAREGMSELGPAPVALFTVADLRRDAEWMFDETVAGIAYEIDQLLERKTGFVINARFKDGQEAQDAANAASDASINLLNLHADLVRACQPFLYVGDVKRPSNVIEARPRLKWVSMIQPKR